MQWNIIQQVHVEGAMKVTKAAWPHMLKQKYGRIIMTSSGAGLYGNVGQANYSAAKLALVGFSNTLAKEGLKSNVFCNIIAPIAGSRLTETVMPAEMVAALDPQYVAPIVAFLCHESSTQNGGVFETGAGYCAQVRWQRSAGVHFPLASFTPEAIATQIEQVNNFDTGATYPTGLNDTMAAVMSGIGASAGATNLGKGKPNNKAPSQLASRGANGTEPASAFASDVIFAQLTAAVKGDPTIAQKVNAIFQVTLTLSLTRAAQLVPSRCDRSLRPVLCLVFQYNLTNAKGDKKTWTVSLKKNEPSDVYVGPVKDAKRKVDVTVDVSDENYVGLAAGKKTAQMLYMKGELKMKGSLPTAMKLDTLLKAAQAERLKREAAEAKIKSKL